MAIVRVRPVGLDPNGAPNDGDPDEADLTGAFTAPRTSNDLEGRARDGVLDGLTLFAPIGTDLVATDLVKIGEDTYRIDGDVGDWINPFTNWEAGITADLVRAAG